MNTIADQLDNDAKINIVTVPLGKYWSYKVLERLRDHYKEKYQIQFVSKRDDIVTLQFERLYDLIVPLSESHGIMIWEPESYYRYFIPVSFV